jgi:hypothetical protein
MPYPNPSTSLIVAERGSAWGRWLERFEADSPGAVLLLQDGAEADDRFAQRVRSHVAAMAAAGDGPGRVVLVGGHARKGALPSRSLMIRAIANTMATRGGGQLLLDGDGSDRFTMRALADTVGDMLRGSGVAVAHASEPQYAQVA